MTFSQSALSNIKLHPGNGAMFLTNDKPSFKSTVLPRGVWYRNQHGKRVRVCGVTALLIGAEHEVAK